MLMRRRDFITLLGGAAMILPAAVGGAESFPTRPIRLIVPYPAGGGTDIVGRVLGQKLHESLGQPVVIDNRGGAGGTLGTAAAAKSAPDGYTLLLVPTSHVINPSIYAKLPFDTEKDFAPITMVASAAILMAVHPRVPADTVRGFVEAAKASPRALANYGSAGTGTVFHLTGELFKQLTGLQLQHVPYRGGAPTVTALLAGEIPLAFETMLALQPHVRAGTLRALAVTSPRRSAIMPEIPTTAEAGFPSLVADNSYALFAPAGTPAPILTQLHDATVAALALPEVRDQLREQGAEVVGNSAAELAARSRPTSSLRMAPTPLLSCGRWTAPFRPCSRPSAMRSAPDLSRAWRGRAATPPVGWSCSRRSPRGRRGRRSCATPPYHPAPASLPSSRRWRRRSAWRSTRSTWAAPARSSARLRSLHALPTVA